jgi:hypothetical protein
MHIQRQKLPYLFGSIDVMSAPNLDKIRPIRYRPSL